MEQVRDWETDSDLWGMQAWKPEQHNNVGFGQANHAWEYVSLWFRNPKRDFNQTESSGEAESESLWEAMYDWHVYHIYFIFSSYQHA